MSNVVSGTQFERKMCLVFSGLGYWAHRFAKDERGAQPFDIIAIKGTVVYAIDCKVCSKPRLALSRAEANQMLSFSLLSEKSGYVRCGFMCYYDGDIYYVPYDMVKYCKKASVPLTEDLMWADKVQVALLIADGASHEN